MKVNQIEVKKIADLIPYEGNPMIHKDSAPELKKSIEKHGFYGAIIIDQKDRIICGHNRTNVMTELGETEIPCFIMELESDEKYYEIMASDNKIGMLSKFDSDELKAIMDMLGGKKATPAGFKMKEIDKLYGIERDKDGNEIEPNEHTKDIDVEYDEPMKKKTFSLTKSQHEDITAKLDAYIKEHNLENESHALVSIMKGLKRAPRTKKKAGKVKVVDATAEE